MFGFRRKVTSAVRFDTRPSPPSLAEGARRLDAAARSLTTGQITHIEPGRPVSASARMMAISPSEAWSRNFMTHGIGPSCEVTGTCEIPPSRPPLVMQNLALAGAGALASSYMTQHVLKEDAEVRPRAAGGPVLRRRSPLARFFFGE